MISTVSKENKESQQERVYKQSVNGLRHATLSEKERKIPKKHSKGSKNETIKIDREEILEYPQDKLPPDAEFKGYQEVIIQDIILSTDNVLFRKEKYYSPSEGKTYLAELPCGYEGEFGPGIKALVISLYYGGNMISSLFIKNYYFFCYASVDFSIFINFANHFI
jgi:hypothetical protein